MNFTFYFSFLIFTNIYHYWVMSFIDISHIMWKQTQICSEVSQEFSLPAHCVPPTPISPGRPSVRQQWWTFVTKPQLEKHCIKNNCNKCTDCTPHWNVTAIIWILWQNICLPQWDSLLLKATSFLYLSAWSCGDSLYHLQLLPRCWNGESPQELIHMVVFFKQ